MPEKADDPPLPDLEPVPIPMVVPPREPVILVRPPRLLELLPEDPTTGWPKVVVWLAPKVPLAKPSPWGDAMNCPMNELEPTD